MGRGELVVRDAVLGDMPALRDIYNALVPTTTVAWTEVPETLRQRQAWFRRQQRDGYPVLVAAGDGGAGEVVGFAAYGSFRGAGLARWIPLNRKHRRRTLNRMRSGSRCRARWRSTA